MRKPGKVYLVGAGPGDPDLLTVKALRLIRCADVVVYDRLVSPEIMDLVPPGVTRIAVGKQAGRHCVPQSRINTLLAGIARSGRELVRLKGGDPFVFGRGSEEALHLRGLGIPFEVVPGITAAAGCAAYAGIPLTHRGVSRRVQLVTGHFREDEPLALDWQGLADPQSTLVVYMGLASLRAVCARLVEAGLAAGTPAAAIENGTTPRQRRVLSTLDGLPDAVAGAGLQAPVLLVIGEVAALAETLDWTMPAQREEASDAPSGRCFG
jgi:uroporphyrin-III C-methyltransferase/precorrin-2 dehydrogenase/sirohydrochlorin ferrochelatase/uroporphyrin-III C-methyltransferase